MNKRSDDGLILEDTNSKFDLLLEAIQPLSQMSRDLAIVKEDVAELKSDVKVIKFAVTDLSRQVVDHENRITALEAA